MNSKEVSFVVQFAKLICDPTRVKILMTLNENRDREMCVYEISHAVHATQSATSHQLAKLEARGLVRCYRDGQRMCYELDNNRETKLLINTLSLVTS